MEEIIKKHIEELNYYIDYPQKSGLAQNKTFSYEEVLYQKKVLLENILKESNKGE